jgi:hypothetical protein
LKFEVAGQKLFCRCLLFGLPWELLVGYHEKNYLQVDSVRNSHLVLTRISKGAGQQLLALLPAV